MNMVFDWIKANVVIVIFVVLMLAALIVLPLVAGGMNDRMRADVNSRARDFAKLDGLEKSSFEPPAFVEKVPPQQTLINDALVDRYVEVSGAARTDAEAVESLAMTHNRKGRDALMSQVFPAMPVSERQVFPRRFHEKLVAAYEALLEEIDAGTPPTLESMRGDLDRVRHQFLNQMLRKDLTDELTRAELDRLRSRLSDERLAICRDRADSIGVYLDLASLEPPAWEQAHQPTVAEMFLWQWRYWAVEDVLRAVHRANGGGTELHAPIKRIVAVRVGGLPVPQGATGQPSPHSGGTSRMGPSGGGTSRMGPSGGGGGGMLASGGGAPASSPDTPSGGSGSSPTGSRGAPTGGDVVGGELDPTKAAPRNYETSFTGRVSNPLYDVLPVEVVMVVQTARIPELLDELAARNFITVTDLVMLPADPYRAARDGYVYGVGAMTELTLILETTWLRNWTRDFMPDDIRRALGIPSESTGETRG